MINNVNEIVRSVNEDELLDLVKELIRIPSHIETENLEAGVAEFLTSVFSNEGIDVSLQEVEGDRSNVIATIYGDGDGNTLLLNGHMDTVVPSKHLRIQPFEPIIKDNKLYGLGSADMKGGLGAMAYTLIHLHRTQIPLKGNLIFAATVGEETEGHGGAGYIAKHGPYTDMAIVGEPTGLKIVTAHKGVEKIDVIIQGKSAHGSTPEKGINAIKKAARFIKALEAEVQPVLSKRKHPLLGSPTLNIGVIRGGNYSNIVPDKCVVKLDRRWNPEESRSEILNEINKIVNDLSQSDPNFNAQLKTKDFVEEMSHGPLEVSPNEPIVRMVEKAFTNLGENKPEISGFSGWTDAAMFNTHAHIPTVVFGPGSIAQAHSDCEFTTIDEICTAMKVYTLTALNCCT